GRQEVVYSASVPGQRSVGPLWRAAAIHDFLCFGSSPVPGRQPPSGDRHGPDAALDRGCL
ncbi:MAG: hypothetical protein, partial [Olavius algarvensis Gamma 1 endosymbiont]